MRIIRGFFMFLMIVLAGCATTSSSVGNYKVADHASDLPQSAKVKVLRSASDAVVVGISGVEVPRVEVYGRGINEAILAHEGEWITFILPKGRWFNFIFLDHSDNMYHFVYVTKEDADMHPGWMDESITTFQPSGWGAAMTAREFRKK